MTEKFVNIEVNDKVFFDSNIFVYSVDNDEPSKKSIAQKLLSNAAKNKKAIISTQNLQEFYNAVTKKHRKTKKDAKLDVENFAHSFPIQQITPSIIFKAIDIQIKNKLSFYDSLIISTASKNGCVVCYSEDLNAGQIIEGVKVINPF